MGLHAKARMLALVGLSLPAEMSCSCSNDDGARRPLDAAADHARDGAKDAAIDASPDAWGPTFEDIAPAGGFVPSLTFHPTDPERVYGGADDSGGLWLSRDRAESWDLIDLGRQNIAAWEVVVGRGDPNFMVIADCYGHGVMASQDGGETWEERNRGLDRQNPDRLVRALLIDPTDDSVLFAGTGSGVYKSIDAAVSWSLASEGLGRSRQVYRLAQNPLDAQTLYAGVAGGEIFRTVDGGETWVRVADLLPGNDPAEFWDLGIAPSDPERVVAAAVDTVWLSSDGGDTWTDITPEEFGLLGGWPIGTSVTFSPTDASTIYAGTFRLYADNLRMKSTNGGLSFSSLGDPEASGIFRIRVSPNDPDFVLVSLVGGGVEASLDAGATWTRHRGPPKVATAPGAFAVAPSRPDRLYLATISNLYRSSDRGNSWTALKIPESMPWALAVHPTNPDLVYMAGFPSFSTGIQRSEDGGANWTHLGPTGVGSACLLTDPVTEDTLYVCGFTHGNGGPFGVYRSTNRGLDFERLTPESWFDEIGPTDIAFDPAHDGSLVVATSNGLYRSDPSQAEFAELALTGTVLFTVGVSAGGLWVAGGPGGFYVSSDAGATWDEHALEETSVVAVTLDPNRFGRILIGAVAIDVEFGPSSAPGLYFSDDAGETFVDLTRGLQPSDQVLRLEVDPGNTDTYLFSPYSGSGGLYRFRIP